MGLEKGGLSGELSSGGVGSNPERASSSGLPAASNVAGVGLDKVGVPGIAGGLDVVNGNILLGSGTEDVAVLGGTNEARHAWLKKDTREIQRHSKKMKVWKEEEEKKSQNEGKWRKSKEEKMEKEERKKGAKDGICSTKDDCAEGEDGIRMNKRA